MASSAKLPRTELEDVGELAQAHLRDKLTSCNDPLKTIAEFQMENSFQLPSVRSALPLLDLHKIPRLDFSTCVLEELKDQLIAQINELSSKKGTENEEKLKKLLSKSFPFIGVKDLRPLIMIILKSTPNIDITYLRVLEGDKDLYNDTDREVKRQIWQINQSLFGDEVKPLLSQYITEKENVLFDHENLNNLLFSPLPRVRRQGTVVQELVHIIGNSVKLYDVVLQFLRTLFLIQRNVHYCTLRAELLMAFHDLEVQEIIKIDPCHKFTWCLDTCIRKKDIDINRLKVLEGILDSMNKDQEPALGDFSMILCDPYAINYLVTSAMNILQHLVDTEGLARDNPQLILLLRLLALGLNAWNMIDSKEFKEPKLHVQIVTKYLPSLMSLMVDDQFRALHNQLPQDKRAFCEKSGPLLNACRAFMEKSSICSVLAMYYALNASRLRDREALVRILTILGSCREGRAYEDTFLHTFVGLLIHLSTEFRCEDFNTVLFDKFFFVGLTKDNVTRHLLKLLWHIHPEIPETRVQTLIKALQPGTQHNESVHKLYEALQQKVSFTRDCS